MLCLKLCINSFFKCHIVGFFEKGHIIGQTCWEQNIFHKFVRINRCTICENWKFCMNRKRKCTL